jgi:ribosomal protein S18 acetylase RimI-like enzyme
MNSDPILSLINADIWTATDADRPALAAFCRDNPEYDVFLTGEVPDEAEWVEDFMTDLPPASFNWTHTHKLFVRRHQNPDIIAAIIDVTEDMIDKDVGHIGLFQVATALHGTGLANDLYQGLEDWLASRGTDVLRLGVLDGNARGMAFWTRHGFLETRRRQGMAPNGKTHLSHVLYKPLKPLTLEAYRLRVPRDDPNSV